MQTLELEAARRALWTADVLRLSQKLLFRWFLRHPEEVVRTAGFLCLLSATV
jgi:hypothetical protein